MNTYLYTNEKPFCIEDTVFAEIGDHVRLDEECAFNISKCIKFKNPSLDIRAELAQSLVEFKPNWVVKEVVDDNVNHPAHYTKHPSGIECIDITRHYCFAIGNAIKYLWRAGLKKDASLNDREKEIEDLKKSIWYINDRIKQLENGNV